MKTIHLSLYEQIAKEQGHDTMENCDSTEKKGMLMYRYDHEH